MTQNNKNKTSIKKQRGQFFTSSSSVQNLLTNLLKNSGNLLEPSAGAGHLLQVAYETGKYNNVKGYELDSNIESLTEATIHYGNFFTLAEHDDNSYDSIIGNPPFVTWKDAEEDTIQAAKQTKTRYQDKTNLYHLFIDRCIDLLKPNGELVFIVPKEWLYSTSATPLREKMVSTGNLTHLVDCGEEKLFVDASVPALLIFRFVKTSNKSSKVLYATSFDNGLNDIWEERELVENNNRFILLPEDLTEELLNWGYLKDQYSVKVGYVTGADKCFKINAEQQKDFENGTYKKYVTTKGVETYLDLNQYESFTDIPDNAAQHISENKETLLTRKISKFTENNFWKYGAIRNQPAMESSTERFYGLVKTRSETPFFINNETKYYGGGVLGIFKKDTANVTIETAVKVLNSPKYRTIMESMFLTTGNKVSLQPATLEDAPFPKTEQVAQDWLQSNT